MSVELLRALADEEVPPSKLRADALLAAGRARLRRRRAAASAAVAGMVLLAVVGTAVVVRDRRVADVTTSTTASTTASPVTAPSPSGPAPTAETSPTTQASPTAPAGFKCEVARLASPRQSETWSGVAAVDPTGKYVVGSSEQGVSNNTAVVLWTDGVPMTFTVGANPIPHDVNASAVVVGQTRRNGVEAAWSYQNGRTSFLTLPKDATGGFAFAVNARGDVAGEAKFPGDRSSAVVWPASAPGTVRVLASNSKWAKASGITDDGTVVGDLGDGNQPYLWHPDGRGEALAVPGGQTRGKVFGVRGDWAYGWAGMPIGGGGEVQWARWNLKTGKVEVLINFHPSGVTTNGMLAGTTNAALGAGEPALWRDGVITVLPKLRPGLTSGDLVSISADGRVVAGSVNAATGGKRESAIWRC